MKPLNILIEAHLKERDQMLARHFVTRRMEPELSKALTSPLVKVITGPRRAGKSTLGFQILANKKFAYLNFEDDSLKTAPESDALVNALDSVYGKTDFIFFDEIQNYPAWESFVNKLQRRGRNLILTGSNSKLLSRELSSALTGRHLSFELLPFSFYEFAEAATRNVSETPNQGKLFEKYLKWGGFPEITSGLENGPDPAAYLRTLFDSIVLRDLVVRHRIRMPTALHDLLSLLINNAANRFSGRSLERSLGNLSIATIQKFIAYAREAYLIQDLQPYFFKPRLRVKADRKAYTFDNGFISAKSQPAISNDARLLENLVFVELVRRRFTPNSDLFYYQTTSGTEVDFLTRQGSKNLELIQVSQSLSSLKAREREIRGLCQAASDLKVKDLTIVTLYEEENLKENGHRIRVIPCQKWLAEG